MLALWKKELFIAVICVCLANGDENSLLDREFNKTFVGET